MATSLHTPVCDLLGCDDPIILAGMGGVARSELVAAVTQAGGFGFLGMVRESPELIRSEIARVRAVTCDAPPSAAATINTLASPVCYADEASDTYAGYATRDELLAFPNVLREAEHAGARITARTQHVEGSLRSKSSTA